MRMADEKTFTALFLRVDRTGEVYQGYLSSAKDNFPYFRSYVGGTVEIQCLTDELVAFFNRDNRGRENRVLYDKYGNNLRVIYGDILCCKVKNGNFCDINEEEANICLTYLKPAKTLTGMPQIVTSKKVGDKNEKD